MESLVSLIVGCLFGVVMCTLIVLDVQGGEEEACRKEYNVYQCERVYVPKDVSDGS
jgi:hypothetical protein